MALVTSGDSICVGERLGKTPDWKVTDQLACLATGGEVVGPRAVGLATFSGMGFLLEFT